MSTVGPIEGLGTTWWVELFDCPITKQIAVAAAVQKTIATFESDYSRFLTTSLVGQLNAGLTVSRPPETLRSLLQFGLDWYDITNGHLNVITGHLQEAQGYDSDYSFTTQAAEPVTYNPHDVFEMSGDTIRLRDGKIDFGAYGKGFLIDVLAAQLRTDFGLQSFLINGGGDMYAASSGEPIEVAVEHPTQPGVYIAKVPLTNQALAVSSTYKRQWIDKKTGRQQHHLLSLNHTAQGGAGSSYIVASTAAEADVLATIAHVTPPEMATTLLSERADAYALWPQGGQFVVSPGFEPCLLFKKE